MCPTIAAILSKHLEAVMNNTDIRLRVPKQMKLAAEAIFHQMGITMSEAMRIFLSQCVNTGGLPFRPHSRMPNKKTLKSFKQIETGEFETHNLGAFEEIINDLKTKQSK